MNIFCVIHSMSPLIFMSIISLSHSNLIYKRLTKLDLNYDMYVTRENDDELQTMSLFDVYESKYNLEYVKIPNNCYHDYNDYLSYLKSYCLQTYKAWPEYKSEQDYFSFLRVLHNFKNCLDTKLQIVITRDEDPLILNGFVRCMKKFAKYNFKIDIKMYEDEMDNNSDEYLDETNNTEYDQTVIRIRSRWAQKLIHFELERMTNKCFIKFIRDINQIVDLYYCMSKFELNVIRIKNGQGGKIINLSEIKYNTPFNILNLLELNIAHRQDVNRLKTLTKMKLYDFFNYEEDEHSTAIFKDRCLSSIESVTREQFNIIQQKCLLIPENEDQYERYTFLFNENAKLMSNIDRNNQDVYKTLIQNKLSEKSFYELFDLTIINGESYLTYLLRAKLLHGRTIPLSFRMWKKEYAMLYESKTKKKVKFSSENLTEKIKSTSLIDTEAKDSNNGKEILIK